MEAGFCIRTRAVEKRNVRLGNDPYWSEVNVQQLRHVKEPEAAIHVMYPLAWFGGRCTPIRSHAVENRSTDDQWSDDLG